MPKHRAELSSLTTQLGARVRKVADKLDMTLGEVAEKLHLNRSTLHRVMCGKFVAGDARDRILAWLTRSE